MSKRKLTCLIASALISANAFAYDLVAMWESQAVSSSDTFYTIDYGDHQCSYTAVPGRTGCSIGYADHGAAFWLPCSGNHIGPNGQSPIAFEANFGFDSTIPMAPDSGGYACAQPPGALPFYRFYKDLPTTDHFYTSSLTEAADVLNLGYSFERTEGYIFSSQISGTVPLYRLSAATSTASGDDVEHRYTISINAKNSLVAATWNYDGVAGYVFDGFNNATVSAKRTGTYNGYALSPTTGTTVPIQNFSPPTGSMPVKGQGRPNSYGALLSNTTNRPASGKKQRISFNFSTGTLFDPGSNMDHIVVILYQHSEAANDGAAAVPIDGLGIFFSTPTALGNLCHSAHNLTSGGQVFVEEYANSKKVRCEANLAETNGVAPLLSNRTYNVSVVVDDLAVLSMTVKDNATAQILPLAAAGSLPHSYAADYSCPLNHAASLAPSKVYCNNPFAIDSYSNYRTGYAFMPVFNNNAPAAGTGVGSISGFKVQWLDQNDTVVWTQ